MQIEAFQSVWAQEGRGLVVKLKERDLSGLPMLCETRWELHLGLGHGAEVCALASALMQAHTHTQMCTHTRRCPHTDRCTHIDTQRHPQIFTHTHVPT